MINNRNNRHRVSARTAKAILVWSLIFLFGCGRDADGPGTNPASQNGRNGRPPQKPVPVAVDRVTIGEASSSYVTTATLEPEYQAQVLARTNGVVRQLNKEEGDGVEQGEVLLLLEDDDQRLKLKQAEINLSQLEHEHRRRINMRESGILSSQEFDDSENAVVRAKAELELAQLNLSYTKVQAPFSGRVVRRLVDLGGQVQPGTALYELMDLYPLLARVHIPANRMGSVAVGQRLNLKLDSNGTELSARIRLISPIVDPETGTIKVTAEIGDYPPGTRPGDFAEARIITDQHENAMLVPSIAVFEELGRNILFVAADGKAQRRQVEVGFVESGVTEILEGIEPDELIVVKGQRELREGIPLEILEGPDDEPSANGPERNEGEAAL